MKEITITCPKCKGERKSCPICKGQGKVRINEKRDL
jgi:DnaJ-class molecular chaperone